MTTFLQGLLQDCDWNVTMIATGTLQDCDRILFKKVIYSGTLNGRPKQFCTWKRKIYRSKAIMIETH